MPCARCSSRNSRLFTPSTQMPGKEGGRRNSVDEQEQDKAIWRCQRQAGCNEGTLVWSLILFGFGVHLANAEEQGCQAQQKMSEKKAFIKLIKSTSHGRGCFNGGLVEGTF